MNVKFTFLFILLFNYSFAQLYVKDNTFVYVNDAFVTVSQELALDGNDSYIYLRKDGQLLQKGTTSNNSGTGKLSVYQEGSVNNFQYNYWCSPIGNPNGSTGNSPFGITLFKRPTTAINSSNVSITSGYNGSTTNSNLTISRYWINKYLSSSAYSQWISVSDATTINAGEGFTMKGTSGSDSIEPLSGIGHNKPNPDHDTNPATPEIHKQHYDFRGKPNDGDITINLANNKFTLTGNPYPSAINLRWFLVGDSGLGIPGNPNCTGIAYFWEHDKTVDSHYVASYRGGYGAYAGGTGVYTPATFYAYNGAGTQLPGATGTGSNIERLFCPIGQGFMIEGNSSGSTATMRNIYRVYRKEGNSTNSEFERSANMMNSTSNPNEEANSLIPNVAGVPFYEGNTAVTPHIKINTLLNNQGIKPTAIAFHPLATDNLDHGMDAKSTTSTAAIDMFYFVEGKELVQAAINFSIEKRIPVGFECNVTTPFKIQVDEFVNFDNATDVYLYDGLTQMYHDIKTQPYSFSLDAGSYLDRFEITFTNQTLSNPDFTTENVFVVFQEQQNQLVLHNSKNMDINTVELYDLNGRFLGQFEHESDNYSFNTSKLQDAVYVALIKSKSNINISQKVIVKN